MDWKFVDYDGGSCEGFHGDVTENGWKGSINFQMIKFG